MPKEIQLTTARSEEEVGKKGGFTVGSISAGEMTEYYVSVKVSDVSPGEALKAAATYLQKKGAKPLMALSFGATESTAGLLNASGFEDLPVSILEHDNGNIYPLSGIQLFAVSGVSVKEIMFGDRIAGYSWGNADAKHLLLGGISPEDSGASPEEQVKNTYNLILKALESSGFSYPEVARTWFYLDRLLSWYGKFNAARTGFFNENGIFQSLVPASTGIGASNIFGRVLSQSIYAFKPKQAGSGIVKVGSPLQCEALNYRSAFSRAVELTYGGIKKLMVSGTASIDPDGKSAHIGDPVKQIELTMRVVREILLSRKMDWGNTVRAIAYFKAPEHIPLFVEYCKKNGLPELNCINALTTVCREELLFELELDAAKE